MCDALMFIILQFMCMSVITSWRLLKFAFLMLGVQCFNALFVILLRSDFLQAPISSTSFCGLFDCFCFLHGMLWLVISALVLSELLLQY